MKGIVREAMEAGAAGFATSFAITHRGADGQPIPSRWAEREEIEALCRAVGDTGRGVIGVNGGNNLSLADCTTCSPMRRAVHVHRVAHDAAGFPPAGHRPTRPAARAVQMYGRRCRAGRCRSR